MIVVEGCSKTLRLYSLALQASKCIESKGIISLSKMYVPIPASRCAENSVDIPSIQSAAGFIIYD